MYIYVGNKNLLDEGGISIFHYSEKDGAVTFIGTQYTEVSAGFLVVDAEKEYLFCVNERLECKDIPGGQLLSFKIDSKSGKLILLSSVPTHTVLPCYIHYIPESGQLLVCNHAKRDWVLQTVVTPDGFVESRKIYDDAVLEVFFVTSEGEIVGPTTCWKAPLPDDAKDNPHLHSITYDPRSKKSFVCDTGTDRIYVFDHKSNGNLELNEVVNLNDEACAPRYGVLHPSIPHVYFNSEKRWTLYGLRVSDRGIFQLQVVNIPNCNDILQEPSEQSAIIINHAGTILYTLIRKNQSIAVFSIGNDGTLRFIQSYFIGFESPRAMEITSDDRFLFVACSKGKAIIQVEIALNGKLGNQKIVEASLVSPSSMALFVPNV